MKANQTNDPAALTATDINQLTLNLRTAYMSQKAQESVVRTADALSLKVDHKRIKADDVETLALLQQMEYQAIVTPPYYSVVVTDKA